MAPRRTLLHAIAAASLPPAGASSLACALFGLRVSSPAVVFLATLSLLPSKPLSPPSPTPITPVVVQSRVPRKSLILFLLSLAALSFLLDGLAYVLYAVISGVWTPGTGVELAALLGLIAYAALAALGAYKDVNNMEIWSRKRVKLAIFLALVLDIAQVVLLAFSVATRDPRPMCDTPKPAQCIPEILHFFTPLLRVFFLLPLLFVLFSPRVVYHPAESQPETAEAESAPLAGQSSVLLQEGNETVSGGESSKYGTFAHGQPELNVVPIHTEVESKSSMTVLWRLGPYILPAKGPALLVTLLHVLIRIIIPFVALSLGAAVNTFLPSPFAPIPAPFGTSPYPYIVVFALLNLIISDGGIPNLVKVLVSRIGAGADDVLSYHYTDHVLGLSLGSSKEKAPEDLHFMASDAITKVLHASLIHAAVIDDSLIGAVVLGILFGWGFGLAILIVLGVYGYGLCHTSCPSTSSVRPPKVSAFAFVQALLAAGALLLGSLYIAKGVTEGIWSAGAWVAWVWYWGVLFLPLTWIPSLGGSIVEVKAIFDVLDKPVGITHGKANLHGVSGVEVKFDHVSLTYPYTDTQEPTPALTSVSFVLPASSVTAIVSTPGSAQSSILKALYRLYDVDAGSIYLNGVPIHSLSFTSLRSLVAAVPDISPEGRTRALSRALEKDARVVLVEGPLERAIVGGRTVIWEVGTSGLDSIDSVDQILVLKDGQIVESGSFEELLQANGQLALLWADYCGAGAPVRGSSSVTASGVVEGYDASTINVQPTDNQIGEVEMFISDSPRAAAASIHATSIHAPTASIHAPSIKPTASMATESVAPSVPTKDSFFPPSGEPEPVASSTQPAVLVGFPTSSVPIAFPKTDDSRSIDSGSQAHVRLPTAITFDTTATPPRVSTPDPTGPSASSSPDGETKRKRISSQNLSRFARRLSLSSPKKGGIQSIPGIAGIAGVLRRDASFKSSDKGNGENSARESTEAAGGSSSAPETTRNSGEMSVERSEKDKEREEKKRKRKSFMEVVSAKWGDSSAVATPTTTDSEPQGPSAGEA